MIGALPLSCRAENALVVTLSLPREVWEKWSRGRLRRAVCQALRCSLNPARTDAFWRMKATVRNCGARTAREVCSYLGIRVAGKHQCTCAICGRSLRSVQL